MAINLSYQTAAQFVARLREYYRNSKREEVARLAKWILDRIEAGDVTDTQVRNAFGMTTIQYTTFKTKLTTLRDNYNSINLAEGE